MDTHISMTGRRFTVVVNYFALALMNVCFYIAWVFRDSGHAIDAVGIGSLLLVAATFVPLYWSSGLWRLTHTRADSLDERQLEITHDALSRSYAWFSVIVLIIVTAHAVVYRLVPGVDFAISVPLAVSLVYLAHTLPGSILAWTERDMPGQAA